MPLRHKGGDAHVEQAQGYHRRYGALARPRWCPIPATNPRLRAGVFDHQPNQGARYVKHIAIIGLITIAVVLTVGSVLWRAEAPTNQTRRMLPTNKAQALTYVALGDSTVVGVGASSP